MVFYSGGEERCCSRHRTRPPPSPRSVPAALPPCRSAPGNRPNPAWSTHDNLHHASRRTLEAFGAADLATAGGKAANLGELTRAGLPVPAGFVITTAAYLEAADLAGLGDLLAMEARPRPCAWPCSGPHFRKGSPSRSPPRTPVSGRGRCRPLERHRGGPARSRVRRPAGHHPRRGGRRRCPRGRPTLLGLTVERPCRRLPRGKGNRAR
ncbi:hypothetical protein G7085_17405 [Tessaracoccus sp. HDW20]|nr:hypothetical protein [Tessaracoccus coleopterorum]